MVIERMNRLNAYVDRRSRSYIKDEDKVFTLTVFDLIPENTSLGALSAFYLNWDQYALGKIPRRLQSSLGACSVRASGLPPTPSIRFTSVMAVWSLCM